MLPEKQNHHNQYAPLILTLLFFILVVFLVLPSIQDAKKKSLEASAVLASLSLKDFDFSRSLFESIVLNADIAYVQNAQTGKVVFHKNADLVSPLASLAKLVTAYASLEILDKNYKITIQEEDLRAVGDHGLVVGESWYLEDLILFMLITSSNDASLAIERTVNEYLKSNASVMGQNLVMIMNNIVSDLNLKSLSFENVSGLDLDAETVTPSALGSAQDISLFFIHAYNKYPDIFTATARARSTFTTDIKTHNIENTNILLGFSQSRTTGSKTGYTRAAGGNLAIIAPVQEDVYIVTVLKSTREGRFSDVEELLEKID